MKVSIRAAVSLALLWVFPEFSIAQFCSEVCNDANTCEDEVFPGRCDVTCDESGTSTKVCTSASFSDATRVDCMEGGCTRAKFEDSSTAVCSGKNSCAFSVLESNTQASCTDEGCIEALADRSTLDCTGESCMAVDALRSTVDCQGTSCGMWDGLGAAYAFSAIQCDSTSCPNAHFFPHCTCCIGLGCPSGVPSCTNSFCSSTYLGRSCKDWENPACADDASSTDDVVDCEDGGCEDNIFDGQLVACESMPTGRERTCEGATFRKSTAACLFKACNNDAIFRESVIECFGNSCHEGVFRESEVACTGGASCLLSQFIGTTVDCNGLGACNNSTFVNSAVTCSHLGSCQHPISWDACSCCDGAACPSTVSSCSFASLCTQCGDNPLCRDETEERTVTLSTTSTDSVDIPPTRGSTRTIQSRPTNGAVSVQADGSIRYTSNDNFRGLDAFSLKSCRETGTSSCEVVEYRITVVEEGTPVAPSPVTPDPVTPTRPQTPITGDPPSTDSPTATSPEDPGSSNALIIVVALVAVAVLLLGGYVVSKNQRDNGNNNHNYGNTLSTTATRVNEGSRLVIPTTSPHAVPVNHSLPSDPRFKDQCNTVVVGGSPPPMAEVLEVADKGEAMRKERVPTGTLSEL